MTEPSPKFVKGSAAMTIARDNQQTIDIEYGAFTLSNPDCPAVTATHTTTSAGFDPLSDSSMAVVLGLKVSFKNFNNWNSPSPSYPLTVEFKMEVRFQGISEVVYTEKNILDKSQ